MPTACVNGVELYWEATGHGAPLVWVHEYGGDMRSWEPQIRYFARRYRVITYNQRGYAPSSVPQAAADYSQALLVEDLHQLLGYGAGSFSLADFQASQNSFSRAYGVEAEMIIKFFVGGLSVINICSKVISSPLSTSRMAERMLLR